MNYESLIFDIDGTLWDTRELVAQGYNIRLKAEGLERYCVDAARLKPLFGKVPEEIADVLFPDLKPQERCALVERCMAEEHEFLRKDPCRIGYPRVRETLAELAKKHRLFIVSNSQRGYPELCMEKLGLGDYIQAHLCFGDTGTSKGQTILRLMREQKIESCVYIGDTQGDWEATLEANIPFIWTAYGFGAPEGYDDKIDAISDLLTL